MSDAPELLTERHAPRADIVTALVVAALIAGAAAVQTLLALGIALVGVSVLVGPPVVYYVLGLARGRDPLTDGQIAALLMTLSAPLFLLCGIALAGYDFGPSDLAGFWLRVVVMALSAATGLLVTGAVFMCRTFWDAR